MKRQQLRWQRRRFRRTTLALLACAVFLGGLVLARSKVHISVWIVVVLFVAAAVSLQRRSSITILCIVMAASSFGLWRGGVYLQQLQPYQSLALQPVVLTGTANIDAVYGKGGQLSFTMRHIELLKPYRRAVPGTIKVGGFGLTMVYRGDRLQVSGKLYPTRGANQATIGYAQLTQLGAQPSLLDSVRRKFSAGMQTALPEPEASFGLGLLVGQRNTLPADVSQALLMVGLTHIIAVSGYNLTVLLEAAKRLFGGRSKVLYTLLSLLLIAGFLLVAGTSASIVRAAVISIIGLTAWYFGRTVRPLLLILLAASLTAWANPVYLWADISWYLSFLAFFGVLVVAPQLSALLYRHKQPPLLMQIVIESLCAELMTIPFVLYIFGQVSLIGLVANMLVVALIPLAMLLGLLAGLAGMLVPAVVGWFAWPAGLLLTYMLDVAQLLSRIPHVFQENRYLSPIDMAACYALVVGVALFASLRRRRQRSWAGVLAEMTSSDSRKETV